MALFDRLKTSLATVAVAAAATLGDFIWYTVRVRHTMVAGLVHGALLLTAVGGAASGRLAKGLPLGTLAGLGGAFSYYVLTVVLDSRPYGSAIPGAWAIMWLLLATLDGRWPLRGVGARIVTGPHDAHRQDPHRPMRDDTGRPRAVIRFRISQPRTASLPCPAGRRARRPAPMMDVSRKNVFSTRP